MKYVFINNMNMENEKILNYLYALGDVGQMSLKTKINST